MEQTETLEAHIQKALAGDKQAFRCIFDAAHDKVFRFLLGQLHDRDAALDVFQDVFIDLWRGLPRFNYHSDEEFWGFVFLIARRKVYAYRKSAEKLPVTVESETLEFLHGSAHPEIPEHSDDLALSEAMKKISATSREIITLRYWSELSFKEIALAEKITENNAKVRHHRAIKELQAHLPDTYERQRYV